jgi:predicted PurR-regulated permease PerM
MTTPEQRQAMDRARASWATLGDRLRTVTPSALGRAVLAVVVICALLASAVATWPTLLPFVIGALLGYAVLPIVDALDRVLPRSIAAVTALLAALAIVIAAVAVILPPLITSLVALVQGLPDGSRLQAALEEALAGLPEDARAVLVTIAISAVTAIRSGIDTTTGDLDGAIQVIFQAALGVVGAVLGLLVLPAWMLTVLSDKHVAREALDRRMAAWLREDAWAIVRLADRSAGVYLRGFVLLAIGVGLVTFLGLELSAAVGGPAFRSPLAVAALAGIVQLVPELGGVLGLLPALLLLTVDPQRAVVYVGIYVASRLLVGRLVGGRREHAIHLHPGLLIPGVVILGQFGPLWLLLSAPILSFGADLVRYLHGRLSDPPRPAGFLPGEPVTRGATSISRTAPVPVAYRRHRAGPPDLTSSPATAEVTR